MMKRPSRQILLSLPVPGSNPGAPTSSPKVLREEERFGFWDARTGLALRNRYSERLSAARLLAYEGGFRRGRAELIQVISV